MSEEIEIEDVAPILLIIITIAGGILRILLLGTKGLWLDETFSVWMANQSVADMLHWVVTIDQHPPLYYFLLHLWINLNGYSPYFVRLLSVIFGVGTIPIVYLIGKRLSGQVMGLAAAALLAFSTFNIYYAQEARMYTLLMFNAAVVVLALIRLLIDPRAVNPIGSQFRDYLRVWKTAAPEDFYSNKGFSYKVDTRFQKKWKAWVMRHHWQPIKVIETDLAWVAFILFSALTLYSHNTAVFLPVAFNIFVFGLILSQKVKKTGSPSAFQAPSVRNWIKAQIGILVLWSPWVYFFIKQASAVYQHFWIPVPTWDTVLEVLKSLINPSAPIPTSMARVIWILFLAIFCLGLISYRKKISQFLFLAALFAVPILGELFVGLWRPIFQARTLIWVTIPLILVLAAGVTQLKVRVLIFLTLGGLLTIGFFSTSDYFRFYQKEDWNTAARSVAGFAEKDDLVLFNSNMVEIPFNYYIEPFETKQNLRVEKLGVPLDLFDSGVLEPEMTEEDIPDLISLIRGHDRVWLVYSHDLYTDPNGLIPQTLAAEMQLSRESEFYGGKVQLYIAP